MEWSIAEVARMANVTARTLRHYDAIGLLRPARTGANGYRYYQQEQLLRLQRVLLLRECGLGLAEIVQVLDHDEDEVEALRGHLRWLGDERERLALLMETVTKTIRDLEEGALTMSTNELFWGLDSDRQRRYEAEIADRFGDAAVEQARNAFREREQELSEYGDIEPKLVELLTHGARADDDRVQALIARHYEMVCVFWVPDRAAYEGLGQGYVDSPEFRARYDRQHPDLAEYLCDAMATYAEARLD